MYEMFLCLHLWSSMSRSIYNIYLVACFYYVIRERNKIKFKREEKNPFERTNTNIQMNFLFCFCVSSLASLFTPLVRSSSILQLEIGWMLLNFGLFIQYTFKYTKSALSTKSRIMNRDEHDRCSFVSINWPVFSPLHITFEWNPIHRICNGDYGFWIILIR